jgi:hypothetical protein
MNRTKALCALGALLLASQITSAQSRLWFRDITATTPDGGFALAPSGLGGVFVGVATSGSPHGPDVWFANYDAAGTQVWVRHLVAPGWDWNSALAADGRGGVFVGGNTSGGLIGPNQGDRDAWVALYDASGNQVWIRQIGSSAYDSTRALASDGAGGAYAAGVTFGSLNGPNVNGQDPWVAHYDTAGTLLWLDQPGLLGTGVPNAAAADGVGGLFVAGGAGQAWLARYRSNGERLWRVSFGTPQIDRADAVAADGLGGAFVAGPTSGALGGPNAGSSDAWIARYDSAGVQLWIRQLGTPGLDDARTLAADGVGGAFAAGETRGDLGAPLSGFTDAWLARYDAAGTRLWLRQFATGDRAEALAPDGAGGVFVAGMQGLPGFLARYSACYPDCNADGALTISDMGCFQASFVAGCP